MNFEKIKQKGKVQGKDTLQLLKNTFVLIGNNKQILRSYTMQLAWTVVYLIVAILAGILLIVGFIWDIDVLIIVTLYGGILFIMVYPLIMPFVLTYYRVVQSWIIYDSLRGNKATHKQGCAKARKNWSSIIWIAIITIFINRLQRYARSGKGILGIILGILVGFLAKGWELVHNFLLPGAVIEDGKNIWSVAKDLPNIKNNVPGALVGVFGVDIVGGTLIWMGLGPGVLLAIISIVLGVLISLWFFIGAAIAVFLMVGYFMIISTLVGFVKTVYFTIFYVAVSRPTDMLEKYQAEMTNYLNYQAVGPVFGEDATPAGSSLTSQSSTSLVPAENSSNAPTESTTSPTTSTESTTSPTTSTESTTSATTSTESTTSPATQQPQDLPDQTYQMAKPYIDNCMKNNYTDQQVIDFFVKHGWPQQTIQLCLERYKKEQK